MTSTLTHSVTCGAVKADSDHGRRGEPAYPLDRDPLLALDGGSGVCRTRRPRDARGRTRQARGRYCDRWLGGHGRTHVGLGDRAARPGRGDGREVDAEVLGELADRRFGEDGGVWDDRHVRGCEVGDRADVTGDVRCVGRDEPADPGRCLGVNVWAGRCGDVAEQGVLASRAAGGLALLDAVADQDGCPAGATGTRGGSGAVRARRRLLRRGGSRGSRTGVSTRGGVRGVDGDDRRAHLDEGPLVDEETGDGPGVGRRELDERLGGLDLDDHVVDGDGVTHGDPPGDDLGLGQTLAGVGEPELTNGHQNSITRSTPSRIRSRSGRKSSSSRLGGYGTLYPPTLSTGAWRW